MAKRDVTRDGIYRPHSDKMRKIIFDKTFDLIEKERRPQQQRTLGVREVVLGEYRKNSNREDAYRAIDVYNRRIGREAFTRETVDIWIEEYEKSLKSGEVQK